MGPRDGNISFYSTFIVDGNESVQLECRRREIYWNEVLEYGEERKSRAQVEEEMVLDLSADSSSTAIQRVMEFMSSETNRQV